MPSLIKHLIFVSLEDWDEIWRRNQFVCARLVERNPELTILFVQPALDLSHAVRKRQFAQFRRPSGPVPGHERVVGTRALKLFPNSWTWGRKFNEWLQRLHLRRLVFRLGFDRPALWLNAHGAIHLIDHLGECGVIYDITDDWTEFPEAPAAAALTKKQDRELCTVADAVIVCSPRLHNLKAGLARNLYLIPNGVDARHYAAAFDGQTAVPEDVRDLRSPVIGYTGTVHPDRVDVALIESIARQLPACTLVFVGPMMLPDGDRERLEKLPNIRLLGPRPYARIPQYVAGFDICMTPHLVTPFTESLNPIKLWEYLAIGKPIISTPVAGFREYPHLVYLASDAGEFAAAVEKALTEDPRLANERRTEADKHSWASRVETIEPVLDLCARRTNEPALPSIAQ